MPTPTARSAHAVRLEFGQGSLVRSNLSGAAFTGDWLWVAGEGGGGRARPRPRAPGGHETHRSGAVGAGTPGERG
ncbi:MAG: hypothetical protein ACK4PH_26045, partial [Aquincola tertiaricarbonis]